MKKKGGRDATEGRGSIEGGEGCENPCEHLVHN